MRSMQQVKSSQAQETFRIKKLKSCFTFFYSSFHFFYCILFIFPTHIKYLHISLMKSSPCSSIVLRRHYIHPIHSANLKLLFYFTIFFIFYIHMTMSWYFISCYYDYYCCFHYSFLLFFIRFFFAGGHGTLLGLINSFIHVIMYMYYMLSAMPSMQKYLWWKRYLTIMQIVSMNVLCMTRIFNNFLHPFISI